MERAKAKHLVLILARELASNVATPMLIIDPDGILVYFNEPAEALLGETFASTGEMSIAKWAVRHRPESLDGAPYELEAWALSGTMLHHRPSQDTFRFSAGDGRLREVTAALYPLIVSAGEYVGAVAIFWERVEDGGSA